MTRTRTWTPLLLAHLATVLAVLLAGVVGAAVVPASADDEDVLQAITAASETATAERTFRATFTMEIQGTGVSITSSGEILQDVERKVQVGSFTLPGLGRMEFRQVGDVMYMKLPGKPAPGGQTWFGLTAPGGAAAIGAQDPLSMLKALGGSDGVDEVGTEEVNGVQTTHYEVDLDMAAVSELSAKNGGGALPPGAADALDAATAEIWIDGDDLPRRMVMRFGGGGITFRFASDFLDYGKPVEVTAPPASDVMRIGSPAELGGLMAGLGAGAG